MKPFTYPMPDHLMTMSELKEYKSLQDKIFPNGTMFVLIEDNDHAAAAMFNRYNELGIKYQRLMQYCKRQQAFN